MEPLIPIKNYAGESGYVSRVGHNDDVDYLEQAYLQALSIKTTQVNNNYALIADDATLARLEPRHLRVFNEIVHAPGAWGWDREWETRKLSPWRRSIKLDTDVILPASIDAWWDIFANHRVLFPTRVETFRGDTITARHHRQLWDDNDLPDIYTAFYYFDDQGVDSAEFFDIARQVSEHWAWFGTEFLRNNWDPTPRDDEIFSIAAAIYGESRCTLPGATVPAFVHMRESLQALPTDLPWHEQIHTELRDQLWIGHYPQRLPFHYISKTWPTQETIAHYERNYEKLLAGASRT